MQLRRFPISGHAPGRVPDAIESALLIDAGASPSGINSAPGLRIGPATVNPNPASISKWVLAREVDAHRNIIDYDWQLDCQPSAACSNADSAGAITSHDLLLRRVQYTSNVQKEETVLRCRESAFEGEQACRSEWALYEVLFAWLPPDGAYRRSDYKSGGLVVNGRLLDRMVYRGRQSTSDNLGHMTPDEQQHGLLRSDLKWVCSNPFLEYDFAYSGEFGGNGESAADVTSRGTGRAFLKSVTKRVSADSPQFGTNEPAAAANRFKMTGQACASYSALPSLNWEASHTTRFSYDLTQSRPWGSAQTSQSGAL